LKRQGGGRVAAHEILIATSAVRNLIREDKVAQIYSAIQTGGALGMQTLNASLAKLVKEGVVSMDEAQARAKGTLTLKDE
jgi:twitching motility protein PilT